MCLCPATLSGALYCAGSTADRLLLLLWVGRARCSIRLLVLLLLGPDVLPPVLAAAFESVPLLPPPPAYRPVWQQGHECGCEPPVQPLHPLLLHNAMQAACIRMPAQNSSGRAQ